MLTGCWPRGRDVSCQHLLNKREHWACDVFVILLEWSCYTCGPDGQPLTAVTRFFLIFRLLVPVLAWLFWDKNWSAPCLWTGKINGFDCWKPWEWMSEHSPKTKWPLRKQMLYHCGAVIQLGTLPLTEQIISKVELSKGKLSSVFLLLLMRTRVR